MFIGYSINQKGYKCYIPETRRVLVSRDVKFIETRGFYEERNWENLKDLSHSTSDRAATLRTLLETLRGGSMPAATPAPTATYEQMGEETHDEEVESEAEAETEVLIEEMEEENMEEIHEISPQQPGPEQPVAPQISEPVLRRSNRVRQPASNWINTRVYYNNQAVAHPIQAVCSLAHVPEEYQVFIGVLDKEEIPRTYEEATKLKVWRDAVGDEKQAMERNHTWDEADLPRKKKTVSSKWVFTIKYHSNGEIERHKARLVARGFTQTYGEDYRETFAPVAKLHTIRVVLSLATNLEWELWQMDVKNAFLQGELEEEVYMTPPPGVFVTPGKVLKLRKAIYGLKQSPRAWYRKLSITLLDRGFRRSEADHTLFTLQSY